MAKTRKKTQKNKSVELLPRTTETNAIGILKDVVKAIREEPLRYDQNEWIQFRSEDQIGPQCGTVCCVAGWVCVLTRPKSDRTGRSVLRADVSDKAKEVLGINDVEADRLFDGSPKEVCEAGTPGSRAYMEAGVRHIERFMRDELGYKGPKL